MAYSLKNHEDRIAKLESKIASSGGIVESSLTNPGYVKFANGLIVNFGVSTKTFKKAFSSKCLMVVSGMYQSGHFDCWATDFSISSVSLTGLNTYSGTASIGFIAIGYLISNRILNYISKFLNSFKNLKAVI